MKTDHSFKLVSALILTGVFLALFGSAHAAEPKAKRTHTRSGSYQDSNGKSGTINSTVTRGDGAHRIALELGDAGCRFGEEYMRHCEAPNVESQT